MDVGGGIKPRLWVSEGGSRSRELYRGHNINSLVDVNSGREWGGGLSAPWSARGCIYQYKGGEVGEMLRIGGGGIIVE